MNFNNINGVWPQIKDYIDSKLGGGVSDKYKHMIYVQSVEKATFIDNTFKPIGASYPSTSFKANNMNYGKFFEDGYIEIYNRSNAESGKIRLVTYTITNSKITNPINFDDYCNAIIIDNKVFFYNNKNQLLVSYDYRNDFAMPTCLDKIVKSITITFKIDAGEYGGYEYSSVNTKVAIPVQENGYILSLKEGWYINYMGCIYDYQGNIVE